MLKFSIWFNYIYHYIVFDSWILQASISAHFCCGNSEFTVHLWHRKCCPFGYLCWSPLCSCDRYCMVQLFIYRFPVGWWDKFSLLSITALMFAASLQLFSYDRSSDGKYLALSSQDGYCTLIEFQSDELGSSIPFPGLPYIIHIFSHFFSMQNVLWSLWL